MSAATQIVAFAGIGAALLIFAWGCYWKSRFHSAKAECYREFADTFGAMNNHGFGWGRDERATKIKDRERRRGWMRLMLCDPAIADALRDALVEADAYWTDGGGDEANDARTSGADGGASVSGPPLPPLIPSPMPSHHWPIQDEEWRGVNPLTGESIQERSPE